jgi:hypothetical protein
MVYYALLGLILLSVSIAYNRETVFEELNSAVPQWKVPTVGDKQNVPTGKD